jgi:hypothetical protein
MQKWLFGQRCYCCAQQSENVALITLRSVFCRAILYYSHDCGDSLARLQRHLVKDAVSVVCIKDFALLDSGQFHLHFRARTWKSGLLIEKILR